MRIAIFAHALTGGGAERVAANLSLTWGDMGHEIIFFTEAPASNNEFENTCIHREQINFESVDFADLQKKWQFKVVVFNDLWTNYWYPRAVEELKHGCKGVKLVQILHHPFSNWEYTLVTASDRLRVSLREEIDLLVAVDQPTALWWHEMGFRAIYIPNPVSLPKTECRPILYRPSHELVWMGRVTDPVKRFSLVFDIFECVKARISDARLHILGRITEKDKFQFMRYKSAEVASSVIFHGFTTTPYMVVKDCALHLMASVAEASPQVIPEAQSVGVPTITLDMPILTQYTERDGVVNVASDVDDYIEAVVNLLNDPSRLRDLSDGALRMARLYGRPEHCNDLWRKVLESIDDSECLNALVQERVKDIARPEIYRAVLREVQCSERFFIEHYLPKLIWLRELFYRLKRVGLLQKRTFMDWSLGK